MNKVSKKMSEDNQEYVKQFAMAVEPAIKWLNENCNPHSYIEITTNSAELKSGQMCYKTDKFIKD